MLINAKNLRDTTTAFTTVFNGAFSGYTPTGSAIAMEVSSSTRSNDYRWLGKLKGMREWIGERELNNLSEFGYQITNKPFENTVEVDADDFEDDQIGIYSPMIADLGQTAAEHPDQLIYSLAKNGNTIVCYDGKPMFAADHPVTGANGKKLAVSNYQDGAGEPWFLMVTKRPIKPIIYQPRRKARFVALDNPDDYNVFMKKKFVYGVDYRGNVGFGLWQLAYMSRAPLTPDNYKAARSALMSLKGDGGRPLNLISDLLVVGGNNEGPGRQIVKNQSNAAGATNEWVGTADLHLSPLLTGA
jgi:phage major head subunit gpT-like protein